MDEAAQLELERLREDYTREVGKTFRWFYCPFLFRDEDIELCKGHVLNQAFVGVTRVWTIQRRDLDNFYGSYFESGFVLVQDLESTSLQRVLADPKLAKRVPVKFSVKGTQVDSYPLRRGLVPNEHTAITIDNPSGTDLRLVLKIAPDQVETSAASDWQLSVEKDLRLGSLVSLIKAAHLTLFRMLGYNYVLSAGGHLTGWTALGSFFENNRVGNKLEVLANASGHFSQFKNMVRPVSSHMPVLKGTISDNRLYVCETADETRWAFIIFIRLPGSLHAVVIPILDRPEAAGRFHTFLDGGESTLIVRFCEFKDGTFWAHPRTTTFKWPEAGAF